MYPQGQSTVTSETSCYQHPDFDCFFIQAIKPKVVMAWSSSFSHFTGNESHLDSLYNGLVQATHSEALNSK